MKVGIIGLGLIGGSMAIDLKRRGFADEIYGVEADSVNAAAAEKIGLVDRVLTWTCSGRRKRLPDRAGKQSSMSVRLRNSCRKRRITIP